MKRRPSFFNDLQPGLFDDIDLSEEAERIARRRRQVSRLGDGDNTMLFMGLGSGSSGNCSYLGDSDGGFLIDTGVDAGMVVDVLRRNAVDMAMVKGILVTHDHTDHIRSIYSLVREHRHIGIYCTPRCLQGILRRHNVSRRFKDYHRPIYKEIPFTIGNFTVTAFDVSHDGTDNVGFFIERGPSGHAFAIATDLGVVTDRVEYYMRKANHIVIESNYDADMLLHGTYPEYLKHRIMNVRGHLDNADTARFIARIYTPQLTHVFLCHLSADNNTPEIAVRTMLDALRDGPGLTAVGDGSERPEVRDLPLQVMALPRFEPTPMFVLRKPEN